jgi:hypothetical protein
VQKSSFFNSVNGDRKYKAEAWAEQIASFIGNGILANPADNLRVQVNDGMNIIVRPGRAWINGYFYWNTEDLPMTVPTADGVLNRIDRIVVQWNLSDRRVVTVLKKGTPATTPVPPAAQRDADIFELVLAEITVNKGAVQITSGNIADTRYLKDICGKTVPLFEELDLTDFYEECSRRMAEQIGAWENQTKGQENRFITSMNGFTAQVQAIQTDYNSWKTTIEAWKRLTLAELSTVISFNFENQFAHEGTIKTTTETETGCDSRITWKALNKVLAEQSTEEMPDDSIVITQKVYNMDGTVYRNVKMIITTDGDTTIEEVIAA